MFQMTPQVIMNDLELDHCSWLPAFDKVTKTV